MDRMECQCDITVAIFIGLIHIGESIKERESYVGLLVFLIRDMCTISRNNFYSRMGLLNCGDFAVSLAVS